MKNEAVFKATFQKAVRARGGFSKSLAATIMSGIPDMYVIMPGFMPVLLEAKYLGTLGTKFMRKIQYTPLQSHFLDECNRLCVNSALGLVGFKHNGTEYIVLKAREYKNDNETISSQYMANMPCLPFINALDVSLLFTMANIPRMDINATYKALNSTSTPKTTKHDGDDSIIA